MEMKKGIAVLLSVLLLAGSGSAFAAGTEDATEKDEAQKKVEQALEKKSDVEIAFKVGDEILKINGESVEVEKPYVVEGTTLVPLRVITEAFGAQVDWDGNTQTITLNYSDVTIILQIGKKTAKVNGQELELLEAPELKDGVTMVPLRFITENFGADVGYNDKDASITVKKENTVSYSIKDYSLILKRSSKERIGDSYLKWSMDNVKSMKLAYRSFDGRLNAFEADGGDAVILVSITDNPKVSLDEIVTQQKDRSKEFTLIEQKKEKGIDGNDYAILEYRSKDEYSFERVAVIENKLVYVVAYSTGAAMDDAALKTELKEVCGSFAMNYNNPTGIEDLSDVDSAGYRVFDNKDMKFSIKVPADLMDYSNSNILNEFDLLLFQNDTYAGSRVSVGIYSMDSVGSINQWAERDRAHNIKMTNPELSTYSELKNTKIGNIDAVYYENLQNGELKKTVMCDVFFSIGDYGYNVAVEVLQKDKSKLDAILASFAAEELDQGKVGKLSNRNLDEAETMTEHKLNACSLIYKLPTSWKQVATGSFNMHLDVNSGMLFSIGKIENTKSSTPLSAVSESFVEQIRKDKKCKLKTSGEKIKVDGREMLKIVYRRAGDNEAYIYCQYLFKSSDGVCSAMFSVPETAYGSYAEEIQSKILESIDFE